MELCGDMPAFEAAVAARIAAESKTGTPGGENCISASGTGENGVTMQDQPDMQRGSAHGSDKDDGKDIMCCLCVLFIWVECLTTGNVDTVLITCIAF